MARILKTLPGSTYTEKFSAKRIVDQLGNTATTRLAMDIVMQRNQQRISDRAPVDTGELAGSIEVKARTAKREIAVTTVVHGAYQEHGTTVLPPQPFIAPVMKSGRAAWEADVRATKATLDKRVAAAERKERER